MKDKLLEWAVQLAIAEELAREQAKLKAEAVKVEFKPVAVKPTTHVIDRRNILLKGRETVLDVVGCGVLQELMVKAGSSEFEVAVVKDAEHFVYGSYSKYAEVSADLEGIDAYPERDEDGALTGNYVFKVKDVEFSRSLTVELSTAEAVMFKAIYAKYKLHAFR